MSDTLSANTLPKDEDLASFLLRASFLHERTEELASTQPSFLSAYAEALEPLREAYRDTPIPSLEARVQRLEQQINSTITQQASAAWYDHFLRMGAQTSESPNEHYQEFPFAAAFLPPVSLLTKALKLKFPHLPTAIQQSVQIAFMRRLLQIAGMTLYIDYRSYCREADTSPSLRVYEEWGKTFSRGEWLRIGYQYPILMRFIHAAHENFLTLVSEVLNRFNLDYADIHILYGKETSPPILNDIEFDLSDLHNHGRTVCRLIMSDGRSLIYKPKSLANEHWFFSDLLPKIPNFSNSIGHIQIINRGGYGWAEDITNPISPHKKNEHMPVDTGRIVALFYALNATDMHAENVVFQHGKAYPVDLETIFNSAPRWLSSGTPTWERWTVLSTELLQYRFSQSAIGNRGNGFSAAAPYAPFRKVYFMFSDQEGVTTELYDPVTFNQETENPVSMSDAPKFHLDSNDFCKAYDDIKSAYLHMDLRAPPHALTRHIFRDTMFYERVLQRLSQPQLLSDGAILSLDLAGLYMQLKGMPDTAIEPTARLIDDEIQQILCGDVPLFWHKTHSTDLYSHNGVIVKKFFEKSGAALFEDKLLHATTEDIREQSYLMEASIITQNFSELSVPVTAPDRSEDFILSSCRDMAHLIIDRAIIKPSKQAAWISYLSDTSGRHMQPAIIGNSYYSGYWGILSFLTAAQSVLPRHPIPDYTVDKFMARECAYWKNATHLTASDIQKADLGIAGIGGEILAMILLLERREEWQHLVARLSHILKTIPPESLSLDRHLDIIGGCAGFLISLVRLISSSVWKQVDPTVHDVTCRLARCATQRLIKTILPQESGSAWLPEAGEALPLVGYAHGTSGIIAALQSTYRYADSFRLTQQDKSDIRVAIEGALAYHHSQRHQKSGSWNDRRSLSPENSTLNFSWCHGLPGMGLGLLTLIDYPYAIDDIERVVALSCQMEKDAIDYYCCGTTGMADFLLEASRLRSDKSIYNTAEKHAICSLENLSNLTRFSSRFGQINPKMFPGLFQGISGIGYTALRFVDTSLPSLSGLIVSPQKL